MTSEGQTLPYLVLLVLIPFLSISILSSLAGGQSSAQHVPIAIDEEWKSLGEKALKEVEKNANDSPCWKEAVSRLNSTCKLLSDIQQSRLAVTFANCHLEKSGRETYPCTDAMTVKECTKDMGHDAFQTYTHFFTHTSHICYFLQSELWQERTEGVIGRLSDTSSEAVEKLEQALEYHRVMDIKQTATLNNQEVILEQDRKIASSLEETKEDMDRAFSDMTEMAEKQKVLLTEMFGTLQSSVDSVRFLMSLLLVEFIGYETFAAFVMAWLVIIFIPQFGYSRVKLHLVLFANFTIEIVIRRLFNYFVLSDVGKPPPDDLSDLHRWLWRTRYLCAAVGLLLYVWEWSRQRDYARLNSQALEDIRSQTEKIMEALQQSSVEQLPTPRAVRHSWPVSHLRHLQEEFQPFLHPDGNIISNGHTSHPRISADTPMEDPDGSVLGVLSRANLPSSRQNPPSSRENPPSFRFSSPAYFDCIPGLPPPVGHPNSPYTDQIRDYIRSLQEQPTDQPSTVAAESSSDSDGTFVPSEDPLAREPIRIKNVTQKVKQKASPTKRRGSVARNHTPYVLLSDDEQEKEVYEEKEKRRSKGRSSQASGRSSLQASTTKRRGSAARKTTHSSVLSGSTTPSVLLSDDEKEIYEEKGKKPNRGRSSQASGRSSLQPPPSTPQPSPGRYNLRPRTPRGSTPVRSPLH